MIPLKEAEESINRIDVHPEIESVSLEESPGRILAEDIISPLPMPPFHKSAMDGYAINSTDTSEEFEIIEVIPAGKVPQKRIGSGQCAKIMTGAMVPDGADRVVKIEVTNEQAGIMKITGNDPHSNICKMGEDLRQGDKVLSAGTLIRPQETAVIASMGKAGVRVYKAPPVGIIATGSELVMPGNTLKQGQIYNSNSFSLGAQVKKLGIGVLAHGVAVDTEQDINKAIHLLEKSCDMILISGGVSMGEYDLVPGILKKNNVTIHFEKIAVKPGKPTLFGTKGKVVFFGVPGNPVSTFVIFEILIKPLLYRMMGHDYIPLIVKGVLEKPIKRKRAGRSAFIPVLYDKGRVHEIEYHGSAHIHALVKANGLIKIEPGIHEVSAGEVDVRPI